MVHENTRLYVVLAVVIGLGVLAVGGLSQARSRVQQAVENARSDLPSRSSVGFISATEVADPSTGFIGNINEPRITFEGETASGTRIVEASRTDVFLSPLDALGGDPNPTQAGTTEQVMIGDTTYTGWTPTTLGTSDAIDTEEGISAGF